MENWLKKTRERIKGEAIYSYESCRIVAANEHIDLDYVLEVFQQGFKKIVDNKGCK